MVYTVVGKTQSAIIDVWGGGIRYQVEISVPVPNEKYDFSSKIDVDLATFTSIEVGDKIALQFGIAKATPAYTTESNAAAANEPGLDPASQGKDSVELSAVEYPAPQGAWPVKHDA